VLGCHLFTTPRCGRPLTPQIDPWRGGLFEALEATLAAAAVAAPPASAGLAPPAPAPPDAPRGLVLPSAESSGADLLSHLTAEPSHAFDSGPFGAGLGLPGAHMGVGAARHAGGGSLPRVCVELSETWPVSSQPAGNAPEPSRVGPPGGGGGSGDADDDDGLSGVPAPPDDSGAPLAEGEEESVLVSSGPAGATAAAASASGGRAGAIEEWKALQPLAAPRMELYFGVAPEVAATRHIVRSYRHWWQRSSWRG
jgi:hypothetical protein